MVSWLHQRVNVIRHNNERVQRVAIAVEMAQRVFDDRGDANLAKQTFARAAVEPFFAILNKAALIFERRF